MSWLPRKKIVVPVDFSEESEAAIPTALAMAESASSLHLIHVLYPLDSVSPGVVWGDVNDEDRERAVKKKLAELADNAGVKEATLVTRMGNPGLEIASYAKEVGAELIVIPSHGYHGMKRLVLGSVAERVMRHAECSVFVLRRTDAE